ncbi:hypothetical protein [Stieleria varia]|uniref:hypothetical protein n=1 Tax=Stieleria varia TaxID=2528005 RepID=UPI0011B6F269|nr:hypothetical protein [Stieleria varia]
MADDAARYRLGKSSDNRSFGSLEIVARSSGSLAWAVVRFARREDCPQSNTGVLGGLGVGVADDAARYRLGK